jgi:hypothetical protein
VILPPDEVPVGGGGQTDKQIEEEANKPDPTSTGPGMFKNPSGKVGGPPATVAPVAPVKFTSADFTPVQGGLYHNLITGQLHKPVATKRPVFKANGEPEWDKETGEQKMEEIPIAEQVVDNSPIGPFVFHHVRITKGLGDPIPGTMSKYEHPQCFPDGATVAAVRLAIGNASGEVTVREIKGNTLDPKDYNDTVYLVLVNNGMTRSPVHELMPGTLAIELMADNALADLNMQRQWILGTLRAAGLVV